MKHKCPGCNDEFKSLGCHWRYNPDHRPGISEHQHELLTGHMMSDASYRAEKGNPAVRWLMSNEEYVAWLDDELGWLSIGYSLDRTAEQSAEYQGGDVSNYKDLYVGRTVRHPELERYSWYSSGDKRYPDVELTPTVLKTWYCGDGGLGWPSVEGAAANAKIGCYNEKDRPEFLLSLFEGTPFEPSVYDDGRIVFSIEQTDELLSWMGEAPPGYEYKWCNQSKEEYRRKKS